MNLSYQVINQKLKTQFTTHKGTIDTNNQFLVQIKNGDLIGYGTGLLHSKCFSLNEKEVSILEDLKIFFKDKNKGKKIENFHFLIGEVRKKLENSSKIGIETSLPILSAIETALLDMVSKQQGVNLSKHWGIFTDSALVSGISTSYDPDKAIILDQVKRYRDFPIIKVKLAKNCDPTVISDMRRFFKGRIWVDVNGGWTLEETLKNLPLLHEAGIELLEQPLPRNSNQLRDLRKLKKVCRIPLVADEDCLTPSDLFRLYSLVDVVAIKLFKCGGLYTAYQMCLLAKYLGFKIMLGCRTESVFGITAISNLSGLADYLDLDGHLDIENDFCRGLEFNQGKIKLSHHVSGLGVTFNEVSW